MSQIVIKETSNEYLLYIPREQKERAKGIEGRRWDPDRVCWVYPRNIRMYNALVSEFGDDLTPSSAFSPPKKFQELSSQQSSISVEQNLAELTELLREREKMISEKDKEIQDLRKQTEHPIGKANNSLDYVSTTVDRSKAIKEIALECLGNDPVFVDHVKKLPIDPSLPIAVAKIIENYLKRVLNNNEATFHDLLTDGKDSQILDQHIVDIAHIIRRQRNFVAHEDRQEDRRTSMARAIFCLFGAVLILPELPELNSANE